MNLNEVVPSWSGLPSNAELARLAREHILARSSLSVPLSILSGQAKKFLACGHLDRDALPSKFGFATPYILRAILLDPYVYDLGMYMEGNLIHCYNLFVGKDRSMYFKVDLDCRLDNPYIEFLLGVREDVEDDPPRVVLPLLPPSKLMLHRDKDEVLKKYADRDVCRCIPAWAMSKQEWDCLAVLACKSGKALWAEEAIQRILSDLKATLGRCEFGWKARPT